MKSSTKNIGSDHWAFGTKKSVGGVIFLLFGDLVEIDSLTEHEHQTRITRPKRGYCCLVHPYRNSSQFSKSISRRELPSCVIRPISALPNEPRISWKNLTLQRMFASFVQCRRLITVWGKGPCIFCSVNFKRPTRSLTRASLTSKAMVHYCAENYPTCGRQTKNYIIHLSLWSQHKYNRSVTIMWYFCWTKAAAIISG